MTSHQLNNFSIWETRRVLNFLEVPGDAKKWLLNVLEPQESVKRAEMGSAGQFRFANYLTGGPRDL